MEFFGGAYMKDGFQWVVDWSYYDLCQIGHLLHFSEW